MSSFQKNRPTHNVKTMGQYKKSGKRFTDDLVAAKVGLPLLILLAQQRTRLVYNNEEKGLVPSSIADRFDKVYIICAWFFSLFPFLPFAPLPFSSVLFHPLPSRSLPFPSLFHDLVEATWPALDPLAASAAAHEVRVQLARFIPW